MIRGSFLLLASAVTLSFVGCSTAPKVEPSGRVEIAAPENANETSATAQVLNEVIILLPPRKVASTEWTLVQNDSRFLQPLRGLETGPDGHARVAFLAARPGRKVVRFFAIEPGLKETAPTQTYTVSVTIE